MCFCFGGDGVIGDETGWVAPPHRGAKFVVRGYCGFGAVEAASEVRMRTATIFYHGLRETRLAVAFDSA